MTIGFFGAGNCHLSSAEAVNAYWDSQPISITPITQITNGTFHTQFLMQGGAWTKIQFRCVQSSTVNTCTVSQSGVLVYTPTSCTIPATSASSVSPEYGLPSNYDYSQLAGVWAFAVSVVVACYILARGMGLVIAIFQERP